MLLVKNLTRNYDKLSCRDYCILRVDGRCVAQNVVCIRKKVGMVRFQKWQIFGSITWKFISKRGRDNIVYA